MTGHNNRATLFPKHPVLHFAPRVPFCPDLLYIVLIFEFDVDMHRGLAIKTTSYFDRRIGSTAVDVRVKFRSDRTILKTKISRLRNLAGSYNTTSYRILKQGPALYKRFHCITR